MITLKALVCSGDKQFYDRGRQSYPKSIDQLSFQAVLNACYPHADYLPGQIHTGIHRYLQMLPGQPGQPAVFQGFKQYRLYFADKALLIFAGANIRTVY